MTSASRTRRSTLIWTLLALVLLSLNLRAAITGVPPVLSRLQEGFGLSGVGASVLTTLPELCVGIFSALAPVLARRIGTETAIAAALLVITAGLLLRVVSAQMALFAGTVLAGAGMATGNVLIPAVIKRVFPNRVGSLTGLAMMLLSVGGAAGAGLAVPLEHVGGWRLALAAWAVPALVAALVWGPLALRGRRELPDRAPEPAAAGTLLRSPLAWCVMIFMGMTSLMFYTLTSWLPEIMQGQGFTPATAGMMNSVIIIIGIPLGFVVPVLAARLRDQRPLVLAVVVLMGTGLAGLLLAPRAGWVWVTVFGVATGSAFPIALTLLNLRSDTHAVTARLSGMAQSGGYLLAACGPVTFGVLHTLSGGWKMSIWLLVLLLIPELGCGLVAARPGFVRLRTRRPAGRPGVGAGVG
ncbi:CynX/NimT family MFS transporter [Amycolatopsis viridis]|uniref:CP family cyanate transporter-like MFS transporter n=1 Tax=Amycolatopsis viridis TaxID=185678 RepID=A0ABX0ST45_9PSEU|nr:MFS transporter [Amycolatopsis viridis]NIH80133.1 CP family cyanate transporter-like MFS transporter [Amycolatopsis viridis]